MNLITISKTFISNVSNQNNLFIIVLKFIEIYSKHSNRANIACRPFLDDV